MDATIAYDTVVGLLANPPSLGSRPNFFNLRELRLHYARALKKVPCPQSAINGWSGAVLSPAMYALIDTTPFHWNISTTAIPNPASSPYCNTGRCTCVSSTAAGAPDSWLQPGSSGDASVAVSTAVR